MSTRLGPLASKTHFKCGKTLPLSGVSVSLSLAKFHTNTSHTISVSQHGSYAAYLLFKASFTYDLCLVSLVQCAAVNTCFAVIKEPPHQNSVRLDPCKKIAAIHGHFPGNASSPPTTRKFGFSGCPHSIILTQKCNIIISIQ